MKIGQRLLLSVALAQYQPPQATRMCNVSIRVFLDGNADLFFHDVNR